MKDKNDLLYENLGNNLGGEFDHEYGANVHLIKDPFALTLLANFSSPQYRQPEVETLLRFLYERLIGTIVNNEFPLKLKTVATRMEGHAFRGGLVNPHTKVVVLNLMRAGMMPAQYCFLTLLEILHSNQVRLDHLCIERTTNKNGKVKGAVVGASKIGGTIDGALVLVPDPMGATGNSILQAMRYYKENVDGQAKKWIIANLIVTPEHIRALSQHLDLERMTLYALRLDRGASSKKILESRPGRYKKEESGLNFKDYILPGAGGIGELLSNCLK